MQRLCRVFTFTIGTVKQFSFKVRLKVLRISADRQLYDREFQIEGALTLNAFTADNDSVIFGTKSNNLLKKKKKLDLYSAPL